MPIESDRQPAANIMNEWIHSILFISNNAVDKKNQTFNDQKKTKQKVNEI